ncbi:MAG TPA: M56 family metallopeptidase [Polyangia bacterium]|nr:M56 family metallopeptidase [Polyangia bacterium]
MSRELVLTTMVLVLCGAAAWIASWAPLAARVDESSSGRALEARAWRDIWLTMLPAAIALATMLGWAIQEPGVTDEPVSPIAALVAAPIALLWLRCAVRAVLALRRPRAWPPLATVGLLRPRVVVAGEVPAVLDGDALAAAMAHERAHVRHRDPLRIWLAQVVTDLQWPSPAARARLNRWLAALEIARDEEAREGGARGEDLAAAVVAVARLSRSTGALAIAGLTGSEISLASRVHRLLAPVPHTVARRAPVLAFVVVSVLLTALAVGASYGDYVVRAMPFVAS